MTLYDKLKPEHLEKLETEIKEKYPITYEVLIKELKKLEFVMTLSYCDAMLLDQYLLNYKGNRVSAVYDIFDV